MSGCTSRSGRIKENLGAVEMGLRLLRCPPVVVAVGELVFENTGISLFVCLWENKCWRFRAVFFFVCVYQQRPFFFQNRNQKEK